jgi:hypothetical protein
MLAEMDQTIIWQRQLNREAGIVFDIGKTDEGNLPI